MLTNLHTTVQEKHSDSVEESKLLKIAASSLSGSCSSNDPDSGLAAISEEISLSISASGGDHEVDIIRGSMKDVNFAIRIEMLLFSSDS